MRWPSTTHVRRYLRHYGHTGHIWQGRFKAFPIQDDDHLGTVVRPVERNAPRAPRVIPKSIAWGGFDRERRGRPRPSPARASPIFPGDRTLGWP